jgi:hypothetical protein
MDETSVFINDFLGVEPQSHSRYYHRTEEDLAETRGERLPFLRDREDALP